MYDNRAGQPPQPREGSKKWIWIGISVFVLGFFVIYFAA